MAIFKRKVMKAGDLVQYHHSPGNVGIVLSVDVTRSNGDIYKILWASPTSDVRVPVWYVHPDWVEVVQDV